jgi:uncharacterized integral membrane protein
MSKPKLIAIIVLAILAVIVVVQNTDSVPMKFLFFTTEQPQAVLLFVATALGFALGVLTALLRGGKKKAPAT